MSAPKGQHFLPRQAILQFFSIPGQREQIYLYRRGSKPVRTNRTNVAKQSELYSFDRDGHRIRQMETDFFAILDSQIVPVFAKLNAPSNHPPTLTADEMEMLIGFISYQFVRTPAFRDMRRRDNLHTSATARKLTPEQIRALRTVVPAGVIPPGLADTDDEFEKLWLEAIDVAEPQLSDTRSWVGTMPDFAQVIFDQLRLKSIELLRADGENFVTCDHPVVIDYDVGFGSSEVFFPVGSHAALLFSASQKLLSQPTSVSLRNISGSEVQTFNCRTILSAENELYAAVDSETITKLFDQSSTPKRFGPADAAAVLGLQSK